MRLIILGMLLLVNAAASAQSLGSNPRPALNGMYNVPNSGTLTYPGGTLTAFNASQAWSLNAQQSTSFVGVVHRFESHQGDVAPVDAGTGKERTEYNDSHNLVEGSTFWISYATYVPSNVAWSANYTVINQLHPTGLSGAGSGSAVPVLITITPTKHIRYQIQASTENPIVDAPAVTTVLDDATPLFDQWANFVHKIVTGPSGSGVWQIWRNGVLILDYSGALGFTMCAGDYWKFGLYRGATAVGSLNAVNIWYANIEISTSDLSSLITLPRPTPKIQIY